MFFRALFSFLLLPGTAAGLIPYIISRYDPWRGNTCYLGLILMALGFAILIWCAFDFYRTGNGTLAHWEPPKSLVCTGLYRYTRNPMYYGSLVAISGQALFFFSPLICAYFALMAILFNLHIRFVEEPWLARNFPEQWAAFSADISRWGIRCKK
ncbi:MAG: isoprenylcysteine carboxylmethyltransferase family protein [bacterium]|nr:isoprenylcysteine carboxylmethyltransferase family protein [bacterium]